MLSSFSIVQNESVAAERTVFGIPFRDLDMNFYSGVGTFTRTTATTPLGALHGSWEVETFYEGGGWVQAGNNATEDGNSGHLVYEFTQAETNHAGRIGVRFSKDGYATVYCWATVIPIASILSSGIAGLEAIEERIALIGQSSSALNDYFDSVTVTTGTPTGTIDRTKHKDGTSYQVAAALGAIDFYIEGNVSDVADTGVIAGAILEMYVAGLGNTIRIYHWDWVGAAWNQVESISGVDTTVDEAVRTAAVIGHTGTGADAGKFRTRFEGTELSGATVVINRALISLTVLAPAVDPADIITALAAHAHDTGVTLGGLWKRVEAWLTGERTVLRVGAVDSYAYKDKDGNVAFEGDLDTATGSRGAADTSGSDP